MHCDTMNLTSQGPTLVNLRRICIRYVHGDTKVLEAGEAGNNELLNDWPSLPSESDSFALTDSSGLARIPLSM